MKCDRALIAHAEGALKHLLMAEEHLLELSSLLKELGLKDDLDADLAGKVSYNADLLIPDIRDLRRRAMDIALVLYKALKADEECPECAKAIEALAESQS